MGKVGRARPTVGATLGVETGGEELSARELRVHNYKASVEALSWYFFGYGRGNRLASFICHFALMAAFAMILLTMIDMGSLVWGPLSALHSQAVRTSDAARESLSAMTALTFLTRVQAEVWAHVAGNLIASFTMALAAEMAWTVRRARRVAPPQDYIALRSLVGAK